MKHKDEVLEIFLTWKKMIETQTSRKIKRLGSNNGGEYTSDPFLKICLDDEVIRHFTISGTLQQIGVAKPMNRTILKNVRCMLSDAGMGKSFWTKAVNYACRLITGCQLLRLMEELLLKYGQVNWLMIMINCIFLVAQHFFMSETAS